MRINFFCKKNKDSPSTTLGTNYNNIVVDTIPPTIQLKGSNPFTIFFNAVYVDSDATSTDNHDGNITSHIVVNDSVDASKAGIYSVNYHVSDSAGNATSAIRSVIVKLQRSDYVGNYVARDIGSMSGTFSYSSSVSISSTPDRIIFSNFSGILADCYANISGTTYQTITIPSQQVGPFTIDGFGMIDNIAHTINLIYTAFNVSLDSENFISTMHK